MYGKKVEIKTQVDYPTWRHSRKKDKMTNLHLLHIIIINIIATDIT